MRIVDVYFECGRRDRYSLEMLEMYLAVAVQSMRLILDEFFTVAFVAAGGPSSCGHPVQRPLDTWAAS